MKTVQTCIRRSSHITGKVKVKNTKDGLMIYKLKEDVRNDLRKSQLETNKLLQELKTHE